ncbi:acyl-CoA thioester hydrolase/BAAT C-terminal domain-containing protein [soil metagenome]
MLRGEGFITRAVQWFGGPGQPQVPCGVAVEGVVAEVDALRDACDRVVVVGTSFGAELGLLLAAYDSRVAAVAAFAPSAVVWAGVADGKQRSHWTWRGCDVPFARLDENWQPDEDPPAYSEWYRLSWSRAGNDAVIPVERIAGEVLLVAGGDDRVWPSLAFAEAIRARRGGLPTTVVTHPTAGHRAILPGERPATGGQRMARGGDPVADSALGAAAWPHLLRLLRQA